MLMLIINLTVSVRYMLLWEIFTGRSRKWLVTGDKLARDGKAINCQEYSGHFRFVNFLACSDATTTFLNCPFLIHSHPFHVQCITSTSTSDSLRLDFFSILCDLVVGFYVILIRVGGHKKENVDFELAEKLSPSFEVHKGFLWCIKDKSFRRYIQSFSLKKVSQNWTQT